MTKLFRPYSLDQQLLLPPDLREWLPEDDLAWFISDTVDQLDLSDIVGSYDVGDGRGQPPSHPAMMVKLLLYAYSVGQPSSRRIEQATHRDVAFECWRVISIPTMTASPSSGSAIWSDSPASSCKCCGCVRPPAW